MRKNSFTRIQAVLFAAIVLLMAAMLVYLWLTPNLEVTRSREASGYQTVHNVVCDERADGEGRLVRQFRFPLDDVPYDATLCFFFSHQNAVVYLDGEEVYSLHSSPQLSIIRTPGCNWAMIPLYREDTGSEVLVELTAVYENYEDQVIEFYVGSKYAVCAAQIVRSLPEVVLSFLNVLVGLLLLAAAIYFSTRRVGGHGLFALATLSIALGLWNFAQTRVAPLLFEGRNTFIYYLSLTMLMVTLLPLTKSVRQPTQKTFRLALDHLCIFAALLDVVQLLLQLTGTLDLRQTLTLTHAMLVIGSVALALNSLIVQLRAGAGPQSNLIWLLGIGILTDLGIYYYGGRAGGLPVTLFTMFLFVLSEGAHLVTGYIRQQHMLEEKETQLTMSRVTIMMSQIRSHFVFNILNAISGMCKYDPEKADETVVRFARYLRNNIDIMEDDRPIPFPTELERLEDYVILEQVRFGERIRFETDIETDQFMLPPLIVQPVVENAIKHGLGPKEEGGTIILRTRATESTVTITVEDDGVGFDTSLPDKERSIGLKNIRFRLEHLVHGTLEIASEPGVGTVVTIIIPREETL